MSFRAAESPLTAPPESPLPLLRPMDVGEMLDETFDLYKKNFRLFFGITVLVNVPLSLLALLFAYQSPGMWLVRLASILLSLVTMAALTRAALERLLDRETTITAAYRQGLRRLPWVLAGALVYTFAIGVGLLLFLIPGILVALWSLLLLPVIVVERRGWSGILDRPRQLATGQYGRLFALSLGLLLLGIIISMVLGALVVLIASTGSIDIQHPPDLASGTGILIWAAYLLISALLQSAGMPIFTTAQLLMYLDLRIRREAYDLELLAASLEARVAAVRAPQPAGSPPLSGPIGL